MRWLLERTGDHLLVGLPHDDPNWIVPYIRRRSAVDAFTTVRTGPCRNYDDVPAYRVRSGHRLRSRDVRLGRVAEATRAVAARESLRAEFPGLPRHQVSVPNPLDLALFSFGRASIAMRYLPVFRHAVVNEVTKISEQHGQAVLFQLETPAVLCAFGRIPRCLWAGLARRLARQVASVLTAVPCPARFLLHLCYGDLAHRPLCTLQDLRPVVLFCNALARRLQAVGRPMPVVHVPMAHGDSAPPTTAAFYRALARLGRSVQVIAGVVTEHHPTAAAEALRLTELALGRRALAVAAPCGLGRRSVEDAEANLQLAADLAGLDTIEDLPW